MFQRITVALFVLLHVGVTHAADGDFIAALKLQRIETKVGPVYLAPEFAEHRDAVVAGIERLFSDTAKEALRSETNLARHPKTLEIVNEILGFKPNEEQARTQNNILRMFSSVSFRFAPADKMKVFILQQESSKAYLRGGGKIPMVVYDARIDKASYQFFMKVEGKAGEKEKPLPVLDWLVIPLDKFDEKSWAAAPGGLQSAGVPFFSVAVHEAVEVTISGLMIKRTGGLDFRWFSDGFAHAVTMRVLRKLGDAAEIAAFEAAINVKHYEPMKQEIDLTHWMMNPLGIDGAFQNGINPVKREHEITLARYALAFVEIDRLIEKHGEEGVRKILKNLAARESVRPPDYFAAIKEETGEDMTQRLRAYQKFETVEDGIQHYSTRFAEAREKDDHEAALLALARLLELRSKTSYRGEMYAVAAGFYRKMGKPDAGATLMRTQFGYVRENFPKMADVAANAFIEYAFDCADLSMVDDVAMDLVNRHPKHFPSIVVLADRAMRDNDAGAVAAQFLKLRQIDTSGSDHRHQAAVAKIAAWLKSAKP